MELDDFKRPSATDVDISKSDGNISRITESFRAYESKLRRKALMNGTVNFLLAVIYITIISSQSGPAAAGYHLLGLGCAAGALYLYLRYRPLQPQIYSLPIQEFLRLAIKRISYFNHVDYLIIIPILMILGTGGGLVFITRLLRYTDNLIVLLLIWVVFFITLSVFGFFAGRKNWEKEYGYLYRSFMEMQDFVNSNSVGENSN